ncbi:MAG: flagellar biosynthesis protein FlhF [Burkholderiaceae bacterium]|nr:flagellar biosynthesis protein FlhF [Burkholderiaceae bacterium]
MNISRFFGSTNREALRQVRLALGPEALIVSNRRVNGGVEILATDPTSASAVAATPTGAVPSPSRAGAVQAAGAPHMAAPSLDADEDVMGAIGEMRGALENRIDDLLWGNQLKGAPQAAALFQTLLGYGFSTALLRAMLKRLPSQLAGKAAFQWARNELVRHLPVLASEDDLWQPGLALALVGPTGVGKTTTIAKLAARCVKRWGAENLVLVTTDTYRIGAHEQLKIYGQILRVPVHVVQDATELQQVMQAIRPDQTILIDNVGISQRDRYITEQAAMLASSGRSVQRLLVLNASSHGDTLDEVARTYANDGGVALKGCIVTKIDEASRLGAVLDTAIRYQLPIHYVSNGQKVPENLVWLSATDLVDQALVQNKQSRALYAPSEADFAALMSFTRPPENTASVQAAENRRKRLLPGLLSMTSVAGRDLSMDDLQGACKYIDDAVAVSEAYDLWRGLNASPPDTAALSTYLEQMIRSAQYDLADQGYDHVLAMHDQLRIGLASGGRGSLRVSLLMDDRGGALTTPMQQLALDYGWQSTCGAAAPVAPTSAQALLGQVEHMHQYQPRLPLVHLFDAASAAVLRQVTDLGAAWLMQSSSVARVQHESCGTTVAAVAKTLSHRPISDTATLPLLSEIAGLAANDVVLWLGHQVVHLAARQQADLPVQLVSLRVLNRHTGVLVKAFYGLSNVFQDQVAPDKLAVWLLLRAEAKNGLRYTAKAWQHLSDRDADYGAQKMALIAAQLGLAAWQLRQDVSAQQARLVAASIIGKPTLGQQATVPAMLKLFALKEMTEA